jgi:hypothetical protein
VNPAPEELVPALNVEVQERDPSLVALVRDLAALEMRLTHLPTHPEENDPEMAGVLAEMDAADLELQKYATEMAVERKVDRYTGMLAYLERQRDALAQEVKRLTARKRAAETIIERMLSAAKYALNLLPMPRRGPRELEGAQSSLVLVKNPGHVVILDPQAVPAQWKWATIQMNLALWEEVLGRLTPQDRDGVVRQCRISHQVMLADLAYPLKTGVQVDGVEWRQDHRVVRR